MIKEKKRASYKTTDSFVVYLSNDKISFDFGSLLFVYWGGIKGRFTLPKIHEPTFSKERSCK